MMFDYLFIKNHGKSIYRDLGSICIFLIRKDHEDSTSQRVCRWSVAALIFFLYLVCILYLLFSFVLIFRGLPPLHARAVWVYRPWGYRPFGQQPLFYANMRVCAKIFFEFFLFVFFQPCLKAFKLCLNTFQACLETFKQCSNTF